MLFAQKTILKLLKEKNLVRNLFIQVRGEKGKLADILFTEISEKRKLMREKKQISAELSDRIKKKIKRRIFPQKRNIWKSQKTV